MRTIWKYEVPILDDFTLDLPLGAKVLCTDMQWNTPFIWVLVDPEEPTATYRFALRGTGHDASGLSADHHIGSFLLHGGALVFHLFQAAPTDQGDNHE